MFELLGMLGMSEGAGKQVIMWALFLNIVLSGFGKGLDLIKDKTDTDADNVLAKIVNKVVSVSTRLLDWLGANRQH